VSLAFVLTLVLLGGLGAFVAGLLGVGGAIVMIPLLLYVPPALHVGGFDVKSVTGVTMVQVFVAAVSGVIAHRRTRAVHGELALIGGLSMAAGSLVGAVASNYAPSGVILVVFGLMATVAAGLVLVPMESLELPIFAEHVHYDRRWAALVSVTVGVAAGFVGAGGAFLLVPLLIAVVGIPLRVTIGTSLGITALAATAGLVGKVLVGQVPWLPALAVAMGAVPGAQFGAYVSRHVRPSVLKAALFTVVVATAIGIWWNVLAG
jgi:uncharacterized membrane protein YfcA